MNDIAIDLENITKSLQLFHFTGELENAKKSIKMRDQSELSELTDLTESEILDSHEMSELSKISKISGANENDINTNIRISKLETILKQVSTPTTNKQVGVKDLFSKIDNSVYKMPWKKLPEFHKNVKLKEYIKDKSLDNSLVEKLLISNPILSSEKCVIYNSDTMKIVDVPSLIFDSETKTYKIIDLNKIKKTHKA